MSYAYDIISSNLAKQLSDCSDSAIVNLIIAHDQRQRLAYFHKPPVRYNPVSPYPQNTKAQLDMRRKAEILKYSNNQQNTKTNNITKKEKWAYLVRGNSSQVVSYSNYINNIATTCSSNETQPMSTTASDVPGPPMNLYYDPTVPLYQYQNPSINNASYSDLPADDTSVLKLVCIDELSVIYQLNDTLVSYDTSNVLTTINYSTNQSLQTRSGLLGSIVTTYYMPTSVYVFSLSIPIGIWVMGSLKEGVIDTTICPDNTGIDWTNDPSYNPHADPDHGNLEYMNACYSKYPGVFTPDNTMKIHILDTNEMLNIGPPVSLNITYSGIPVNPVVPPTIYTSLTTSISGQQHIQFQDVSFSPYEMEAGQFFGIQYVGSLKIDNLQLNVQAEQVFDLALTMNYSYNDSLAEQFDYFKTGIFFNLSQLNQNITDGITFASQPSTFVPSSFSTFAPTSIVSITTATIRSVGLNYVIISSITGQYDHFILYRADYDISNSVFVPSSQPNLLGVFTGDSYSDLHLSPNMEYTYSIQPIFNGVQGTIFPIGTASTKNITIDAQIDYTSLTSTSVTIRPIVGTYSSYTILRDISVSRNDTFTTFSVDSQFMYDTSFTGLTQSVFTDSHLVPGNTYMYSIQPYFSDKIGPTIIIGNITTFNPYISHANYTGLSTTSIAMDICGHFTSFTVVRNGYPSQVFQITSNITNRSTYQYYQFIDTNVNTSTTKFPNGFVLGQSYSYSIIPCLYNEYAAIPQPIYGKPPYVLNTIKIPLVLTSIVVTRPIKITNSFVNIYLNNYRDYYYISVARIVNGICGPYTKQPPNRQTYVDKNVFTADTSYAYSMIPYNNIDISGNTYTTIGLSPLPIFNIKQYVITSRYVSFELPNTPQNMNNYHHVNVTRTNTYNGIISSFTFNKSTSIWTDIFNPQDDLPFDELGFTYLFTPYNILGGAGIGIKQEKIAPIASIEFHQYLYVTSTEISFNLLFTNTFHSLRILPFICYKDIYTNEIINQEITSYDYSYNVNIQHPYYYNYSEYQPSIDRGFIPISYDNFPKILSPNNTYYFKIYPQNAALNVQPDQIVTTPFISPTPYVHFLNYNQGNVFFSAYGDTQDYTTLKSYFNYTNDYGILPSCYYINIYEISGGIVNYTNPQKIVPYNDVFTYTSPSDLFANVAYQYLAVPCNFIDVSGPFITTPLYSPKSSVNIGAFSYNETDVSISILPSSMYSYLIITRYKSNVFDQSFVCTSRLFEDISTTFYGGFSYSYSVKSYNAIGIQGDSYVSSSFSPMASMNNTDVSVNFYPTAVSFVFVNSQGFSNVSAQISKNGGNYSNGTIAKINNSVYNISNSTYVFYADSSYHFIFSPFNALGVPNTASTLTTTVYSPPATISIGPISISNTDISFNLVRGVFGSSYYYISVSITSAGIPGPYEQVPITATFYDIDPPYTSDTSYSVTIRPYNALDVLNTSSIYYSTPISPAPFVYVGPVHVSYTDISFAFLDISYGYFYYVYVSRRVGKTQFPYVRLPVKTPIYVDPSNTFYADTSYSYTIVPFNILDVSNTSAVIKTPFVSPPATVSVGIPSVSYTDISMVIVGKTQRQYYYVYVQRFVRGRILSSVRLPFATTLYIDPSNVFTADTSYSYNVIPYNATDISNGYVMSIPVSPVATFSQNVILYASATDISFQLSFSSTYSYISVARYTNGTIGSYMKQPAGIRTYIDPSNTFTADTSYSYSILPYNAVDNPGIPFTTTFVSPPTSQPDISFTVIDTSNIAFTYADITSFYYVSIARFMNSKRIDTTKQPPYTSIFTDPSHVFYPDSSYAYALLPYSTSDVSNIKAIYYSPAISPPAYAQVSPLSISGDFVSFVFTQGNLHSFHVADVTSISGGILGTTRRIARGTTRILDTSNVYTADTSYGFSITPYNVLMSPGTIIKTNVDSPMAQASFVQYTDISYHQIQFTYTAGKNKYSYVRVRRIVNGRSLNASDIKQPVGATIFSDSSSVPIFTADSSYCYYVIPYNAVDNFINQNTFLTYPVSPYPYANLGPFSSVTNQQIQFSFVDTTSFYVTSISRIVDGIIQPWIRQPHYSLSVYSDISGPFFAYSTYQYQVIPYNAVDTSGRMVQTSITSAPASVSFSNYNLSNTQINGFFTQSTTYKYVKIYEISGGTVDSQQTLNMGTVQFIQYNVHPSMVYQYHIIPYNAIDVSFTRIITPPISPIAYISDSSFTIISSQSMGLVFNEFNQLAFSTVSIARLTNGIYMSYTQPDNIYTYQETDTFYANNAYAYSLIPRNALDISGTEWITVAVSPTPSVTFVSYSDLSFTSVQLNFDYTSLGSYSYVIVTEYMNDNTWGNSIKSSVGDTTLVDTYITASNSYTYVIVPYNAVDISGTPVTTTVTISPPAKLDQTSVSIGYAHIQAINLVFSNPSSFQYLDIALNTYTTDGSLVDIGSYVTTLDNNSQYTDTSTTFQRDNIYQYSIIPYNGLDVSGEPIITPFITVRDAVVFFDESLGYTLTTSSISFHLLDVVSFYYVSITPIYNGISQTTMVLPIGTTSYTDNNASRSDVSYCYRITPYNTSNENNPINDILTPIVTFPATVSFGNYTSVTPSSVSFTYVPGFSHYYYVSISSNVNDTISSVFSQQPIRATSFQDDSITHYANSKYNYTIVPYNCLDISNVSDIVTTPWVSPIPTISYWTYSGLDSSSVTVEFGQNTDYLYVKIAEISGGMVGSPIQLSNSASVYTYYGLSPNVVYQFQIGPYNAVYQSGTMITTSTISPIPMVSIVSVSVDMNKNISLSLSNNTSFYDVSIAKITNGIVSSNYVGLSPHTTSYTDSGTNLFADSSYVYQIIPHNVLGTTGNTVYSDAVSPYATVSIGSIFVTTTCISFNILNNRAFSSVNLTKIVNGKYGISQSITTTTDIYTFIDPSNTFTADSSYAYSMVPLNAIGVSNSMNNVVTTTVSPHASSPVFVGYISVSPRMISWSYQTTGKCYFIQVTRIVQGVLNNASLYIQPIGSSIYVDPSNSFTADSSYAYSITPYNAIGILNNSATSMTIPVSPDASSVVFVGYVTVSSTTISWNYQTRGLCYSFQVARYINGILDTSTVFASTVPGETLLVDMNYPFQAQNTYSYQCTPMNAVYRINTNTISNTPLTSPPASIILGTMSVSNSNITIYMGDTTLFYRFSVLRRKNGKILDTTLYSNIATYTDPSGNGFDGFDGFNGFTADSSYAYTITPYNAINMANTAVTTIPVSPSASVTIGSISITNNASSVTIPSANTFYYLIIQSFMNDVPVGQTSTIFNGGTGITYTHPNTTYYAMNTYSYAISTYNAVDIVGTPITTIPVSPVSSVSIGTIFCSYQQISFPLTNVQNFYSVLVARIVNGTHIEDYQPMVLDSTYTYTDPSNTFYSDISYAYAIQSYNAVGVLGSTYITRPISPSGVISEMAVQYMNVVDKTGLYMYYPFETVAYSNVYLDVAPYIAVVDLTGLIAYYHFDTPTIKDAGIASIGSVSCTSSQISMSFVSSSSSYNVSVVRLVNGQPLDTQFLPPGSNIYTDPSQVFDPVNVYSYTFVSYNLAGIQGTSYTTQGISPAPTISAGSFSLSSQEISFTLVSSASFTQVSVQRWVNGQSIELPQMLPIGTTVYVDPSNVFYTDVSYAYSLVPYNALGMIGTTYMTPYISPLPYVTATMISYNSTDISMVLMGDFRTVTVRRNVNGQSIEAAQWLSLGTTLYVDPSHVFYPVNAYSYTFVPYSTAGVQGLPYTSTEVAPIPSISMGSIGNMYVSGNDISFVLLPSLTYTQVAITRYVNGQSIETTPLLPSGTTIYVDPGNVFYPANAYSYAITPYNVLGMAGITIYTNPVSSYPTVVLGSPWIAYQSISFAMFGVSSFYQVAVQRLINRIPIESFQLLSPSVTSMYTDPNRTFSHDASYSYAVIPYNAVGQAGIQVNTPDVLYTIYGITSEISSQYTNIVDGTGLCMYYPYEFVNNISPYLDTTIFRAVVDMSELVAYYNFEIPLLYDAMMSLGTVSCTNSSIIVSFVASNYNVSVTRLINGQPLDTQYIQAGTTVYADPSQVFYPINIYSYTFVPYNDAAIPGTAYTTVGVSPAPSISTGPFSINSQDISFVLNTTSSFTQVSVQRHVNGQSIEPPQMLTPGTTVYVDPSNVFYTDVSYSYSLVPYNALGMIGTTYMTPYVSPFPYVVAATVSYNSTDISMTLTGDFHTVTVKRNVNGQSIEAARWVSLGTTLYVDPSHVFYPVNTYSYTFVPYSRSGIAGVPYTTMAVAPLPSISMGSVGNMCVSGNDISFALLPSLTYSQLAVARMVGGVQVENYQLLTLGTLVYMDTGIVLSTSVLYSYAILPYNVLGISGTAITTIPVSAYPWVNVGIPEGNIQTISFDISANSSFYQIAVQRLLNGTAIESFQLLSPSVTTTYTDPSNVFVRDISYSYAVIPYNVLGQTGTTVFTTPILISQYYVISATAIQYMNIVNMSGIQMYYPFDYVTNTTLSLNINAPYMNIVDVSGMMMYYNF